MSTGNSPGVYGIILGAPSGGSGPGCGLSLLMVMLLVIVAIVANVQMKDATPLVFENPCPSHPWRCVGRPINPIPIPQP